MYDLKFLAEPGWYPLFIEMLSLLFSLINLLIAAKD